MDALLALLNGYTGKIAYLVVAIIAIKHFAKEGRTEMMAALGGAVVLFIFVFYPVAIVNLIGGVLHQVPHLLS